MGNDWTEMILFQQSWHFWMFLRSCLPQVFSYIYIILYKWFHVSLMVGTTWRSSRFRNPTSKLENHPQKPSKSIQRQCLKSSSGTSAPCCVFFGCQAWTNRIRRQAECGWLRQSLECHVACTWQVEVPENWRALEQMAKTGFIWIYIFDAIDKYTSH